MLQKMRESINRLLEVSHHEITWEGLKPLAYLTCLEIESNYLMLVTTPKNLEVVQVMKESFSEELNMYDETPEQRHRQRIYLMELLLDEINKEVPSTDNVIKTITEYAIIIKKDAGFNEYLDTMQVGVELAGAKMPRMQKVLFSKERDWRAKREITTGLADFIQSLNDMLIQNIYFGNKEITIMCERPIFIDHDDIKILIDTVGSDDPKPARQVMNRMRKQIKEVVAKNEFYSGLDFYYYGHHSSAQINIIDDWYDELEEANHPAIDGKTYGNRSKSYDLKFYLVETEKPEDCNQIVFRPKFEVTYEDFTERLFTFLESKIAVPV